MTLRVIIADDHRMLRELLCGLLEREADMEVVGSAANGRELIAQVRDRSPDVVVVDIAMPELNGIEATARIVARNPKVRVIALSAYADRRYVLEMLKAGAVGYVIKASAGTELIRAIRAVAAGQSYLCPEVAGTVIGSVREAGMRHRAPAGQPSPLGSREREVLQLIAEGHRSQAIAKRLSISVATVDTHRRNIMRKLQVHTVAELTKFAIREGLTST